MYLVNSNKIPKKEMPTADLLERNLAICGTFKVKHISIVIKLKKSATYCRITCDMVIALK